MVHVLSLYGGSPFESPVAIKTVELQVGTTAIGRDLLEVADKRLSRKQVEVHVSEQGDVSCSRSGVNASFVQADATSAPRPLLKDVRCDLQPGAVVWLTRDKVTAEYSHPISFAPTGAAWAVAAPVIPIVEDVDDEAPSVAAGSALPAPVVRGVWEVKLGGDFKPYLSAEVQCALEAAWSRDEVETEVEVRGQAYVVELQGKHLRQLLKADRTKSRAVRRRAPPAAVVDLVAPHVIPTAAAPATLAALAAPIAPIAPATPAAQACPPAPARPRAPVSAPISAPISAPAPAAARKRSRAELMVEQEGEDARLLDASLLDGSDEAYDREVRLAREVHTLRQRGEAIDACIFDDEADVDGELRYLLKETSPQDCAEVLPLYAEALRDAEPGSLRAKRLEFVRMIVQERAGDHQAASAPSAAASSLAANATTAVAARAVACVEPPEPMDIDCTAAPPPPPAATLPAPTLRQLCPSAPAPATAPQQIVATPAQHATAATPPTQMSNGAGDGSGSTENVEMLLLDMKESGDAVDLYGVLRTGASAMLRASGFRNFFYAKLRGASSSTPPPTPSGASPPPLDAAARPEEELIAAVNSALVAEAGGSSASSIELSLSVVDRTPLFACYEAATESPSSPPTPTAVRWLRVEYGSCYKPKELLEKLRRAPSLGRGVFEVDDHGEVVSAEDDLSPAGTTKLLRRFAIEKDLAGGAWLTATALRKSLGVSRCAVEYACTHTELEGHAPDILSACGAEEQWSVLPALSVLSVRVLTSLGLTTPQWEHRESADSQAIDDSVELIAAELRRGGGSTTFVLALGDGGTHTLPPRAGGAPIELRTFADEKALLVAFERLVRVEADPDVRWPHPKPHPPPTLSAPSPHLSSSSRIPAPTLTCALNLKHTAHNHQPPGPAPNQHPHLRSQPQFFTLVSTFTLNPQP